MSTHAQLVRPWRGRVVLGVCAGLADRTSIDANVFRLMFVLLAIASGFGVLAYLCVWVLVPPVGARETGMVKVARANLARLPEELGGTGQRIAEMWSARDRKTRVASIALLGGGLTLLLWSFGAFAWLTASRLIAVVAIIAGVGLFIAAVGDGRRR